MPSPTFQPILTEELTQLHRFLQSEQWHFYNTPTITDEDLENDFGQEYISDGAAAFWIFVYENRCGIVQVSSLDEYFPQIDLRLSSNQRGKGLGTEAVKWIVNWIFGSYPEKWRIEAETRSDNLAMQRVLEKLGFTKEAHYRKSWKSGDQFYDAFSYSILREEWEA